MSKDILKGLFEYLRTNVSEQDIEEGISKVYDPIPVKEDLNQEKQEEKEIEKNEKEIQNEKPIEGKVPKKKDDSEETRKALLEQEKEVVIGTFSDEDIAKEVATSKRGKVVQDPDTKMYKVIVKENKKEIEEKSVYVPNSGDVGSIKIAVLDDDDLEDEELKKYLASGRLGLEGKELWAKENDKEMVDKFGNLDEGKEKKIKESEEESISLPKKVEIPKECLEDPEDEEEIADYLSDKYGFLINSFNIKDNGKSVLINNIDWDVSEKKTNWEQKAFAKNKGSLHKALGVPEGEKIPKAKMAKAYHSKDPKLKMKAVAAINAHPDLYPELKAEMKKNKETKESKVKESLDDFTVGFAQAVQRALKEILGAEVDKDKVISKLASMDRVGLEALKQAIQDKNVEILKQFLNMLLESKQNESVIANKDLKEIDKKIKELGFKEVEDFQTRVQGVQTLLYKNEDKGTAIKLEFGEVSDVIGEVEERKEKSNEIKEEV